MRATTRTTGGAMATGAGAVTGTVGTAGRCLVSVVTPVHNGEQFLAECIESVLAQTYEDFEYIIVDDGSTDASLNIMQAYARKDGRIRVERCGTSAGVIESHNIAFGFMSPMAKYCKVVSPEDVLFPECVARMVEVAEADPSVGIVGSYQLCGSSVKWQGFAYPRTVVPGREICRRVFIGGETGFGFGTPTSLLYRADLVRSSERFYPHPGPHADTSACFKYLQNTAFGFVFQVLAYGRLHRELVSARSAEINRYASAYIQDLMQYGPLYLDETELARRLREELAEYYRFLAVNAIGKRGREFWEYHRGRLEELGYPMSWIRLLKAGAMAMLRESVNPGSAMQKGWRRLLGERVGLDRASKGHKATVMLSFLASQYDWLFLLTEWCA